MDAKTSLFAHARPRVALPKKTQTPSFLALPGEIRNRVYEYYFQGTYRCELVGKDRGFTARNTTCTKLLLNGHPQKPRHDTHLDKTQFESLVCRPPKEFRAGLRTYTGWFNEHVGLILVCKQVHLETLPLLYQRITFGFGAPRRITSFLLKVPKQNHINVIKLHLFYTTYGSPSAACNVIWQEKHIESWTRACKMVSRRFNCLQELKLDVWISDTAPKFNLRQKWLQPLLQFRRLTRGRPLGQMTSSDQPLQRRCNLKVVHVSVKTRIWAHDFETNTRLANACKDLHRLFGLGISSAILGAKEEEAMAVFEQSWNGKYRRWQHHLGFARTGW